MSKTFFDPTKIGVVTQVEGFRYGGSGSPKDKEEDADERSPSPEDASRRKVGGRKGFGKYSLGSLGKPKKTK